MDTILILLGVWAVLTCVFLLTLRAAFKRKRDEK